MIYYYELTHGFGKLTASDDREALKKMPSNTILLYKESDTENGCPFIVVYDHENLSVQVQKTKEHGIVQSKMDIQLSTHDAIVNLILPNGKSVQVEYHVEEPNMIICFPENMRNMKITNSRDDNLWVIDPNQILKVKVNFPEVDDDGNEIHF